MKRKMVNILPSISEVLINESWTPIISVSMHDVYGFTLYGTGWPAGFSLGKFSHFKNGAGEIMKNPYFGKKL
jgi:hypothetical protein